LTSGARDPDETEAHCCDAGKNIAVSPALWHEPASPIKLSHQEPDVFDQW
jgi:hypothetical protein